MIDMMSGVGFAMQRMHIWAKKSSPMELVGVHTTFSLKKTQSLFEEAHHWNIQAKFIVWRSPHSYMHIWSSLWSTRYRGSTSVDLSKGIVVLPASLFLFTFSPFYIFLFIWWPPWLFLFNSHLSSLGSFKFVLFGIFSSLKGNTLFYKKV